MAKKRRSLLTRLTIPDNEIPFSRGFPKMMRGDYRHIGNADMFYYFERELRHSLSEEGYLS